MAHLLRLLREGELTLDGRLVYSSNGAFVGTVTLAAETVRCVYKPIAGERPLRDFPEGTLAFREVAAFLVSQRTPWRIVPPTVLRDGPHGRGMVQLWIDVDESIDVAALVTGGDPRLRSVALFDAVVNNTDRKGGHLLATPDGRVYGVDHGITFSSYPKLRTILWGWRGQALSSDEVRVLEDLREALDGALGAELRTLLDPDELRATLARIDGLIASRRFPHPNPNWPAVPWPTW